MESPSIDQLQDTAKVDVNVLMQERLPRYVVNCFQAAGYDELEVIASMDTTEGETNSISKIEKYIDSHHKSNPDMLPSYSSESFNSLPFEFPPGHRVRICNFVQEIKQLYRNTKSTNVSTKHCKQMSAKRLKLMTQQPDELPLSVDEIAQQVHESIRKWIQQQKQVALKSFNEGKHYSVIVNNHGNGQIAAVVKCGICHTTVRLHSVNRHYQISNWTRHIKRCTANTSCATSSSSRQTKLFSKVPTSTVKNQTKQSDSASKISDELEPSLNDLASDNIHLDSGSSNSQVFCQAPPLLQKEGQI